MLTRPYYVRSKPMPQSLFEFGFDRIDLSSVHLEPYPVSDPAANPPDLRPLANSKFDGRAAASIRCAVGRLGSVTDRPFSPPPRVPRPVDGSHHSPSYPRPSPRYQTPSPSTGPGSSAVHAPSNFPESLPPPQAESPNALLQIINYPNVGVTFAVPTAKCLPAMAFADYFLTSYYSLGQLAASAGLYKRPISLKAVGRAIGILAPLSLSTLLSTYCQHLRSMVSNAIMAAAPGWCGTFGPGVTGALSLEDSTGDYDMTQMFLLPLVYSYYSELTLAAQEKLISHLLARGRIQRPRRDDTLTSGEVPDDWSRAGFVSPFGFHADISETENHVLMIATTRYLVNQLLYQRNHEHKYDNRRNGDPGRRPSCLEQLMGLLRNYLRNDFAEYNSKNYQEQTRHALLNLCTYAYDAKIRLGAKMVLDYISAHIAVSSNDLRRMVPFRRLNRGGM